MRLVFLAPSLVAPVVLATAASGLHAQTLGDAARLLARGDTSGAIAVYEALVRADRRNAEARYLAGLLYMTRHTPGASLSPNRRRAEEHFRYATRFEADSAKYWLALAELFRGEDYSTTRIQVARLVDRARQAAARAGDSPLVADVEYRAARIDWERYEHFGHRFLYNDFSGGLDADLFSDEWRYVERFFSERSRRIPRGAGERQLMEAEDHLWHALERAPDRVDVAGLLVVVLGEHGRWEEARGVTRRLTRTAPDDGNAWALHGLTLARNDRWQDARAAFDSAFVHMSSLERTRYGDLGQILRAADRVEFEQLGRAGRARLDTLYWRAAQPLTLSGTNELQTEFYARITYVDHRWSDPLRGYRGHETDRGAVWVRYGPPALHAVFNRSRVVWLYPRARMRYLFTLTPGFARARFAGRSREDYRVAQISMPARFDNVPIFRDLDTVLAQVAQFRASGDSTDLAVFSFIPVGRIADSASVADLDLALAGVLQDTLGGDVLRTERHQRLPGGSRELQEQRTWRWTVKPAPYYLRVEAFVPVLARGARSTEMLDVRSYRGAELALSDILVADRVAPRDSLSTRWTDFYLEPSAGRFQPDQPIAMLWEVYNLAPDSSGTTRYRVDLQVTVTAIERRTLAAQILGGIGDAVGLSALGDDRIVLSYDRAAAGVPGGTAVEYLTLELRDAPEGAYAIAVTVTDLVSGRSATRQRQVAVTAVPLAPGR